MRSNACYPPEPVTDPAGPAEGTLRVCRGGSFYDTPPLIRVAKRRRSDPAHRVGYLGFRLVRSYR